MQEYANRALFHFVLFIVLLSGCTRSTSEDLPAVTSPVELIRYEQVLADFDTTDFDAATNNLLTAYPDFTRILFDEILGSPVGSELFRAQIRFIQNDSSYLSLYQLVEYKYENFAPLTEELGLALQNYSRTFNHIDQIPIIYTFLSGFSYQCLVFEQDRAEAVGIGLDLFLGEDFAYSEIDPGNPNFSKYLVRRYNRDHLVKKVIEVLIEDKIPPPADPNFLSLILWGGKKLYLMEQILDFKPDTVIFEYSPAQLAWCRSNETQMWNHFFQMDLFYQTDIRKFNKLISPSPYSPGMPPESPGRTGNYMGYRIVQSYMDRYPQTSAEQLISFTDEQEFLKLSKFKPKR